MKKSYLQLATVLFCGFALILWMGAGSLAQSPTPADEMAEISAQLQTTGAVPIIVELATNWHVDQFGEVSAASVQEAAIASAQQTVLGRMSAFDVTNVKRYQSIPQLALTVSSQAALDALSQAPEVARIQLDRVYAPALQESVPLIRADRAHALFYTGNGQVVAVLDTGVAKNHPDLAGKVVAEACFSTTNASQGASSLCPGGQDTTATNSGLNCAANISGCFHGTHVAGIVAGVAPQANLIAIQVFSNFGGSLGAFSSDLILALERVLALKQQGLQVASVNMSLGGGRFTSACDGDARRPVIELLAAQGVATVIAAGNSGNRDAMSAPACISAAISVAASTDNDAIASFSNISSITTLYAPGVDITSAVPETGRESFNGTSMATPHVAGAVAIFKQAKPSATVAEIRNLLVTTGPTITDNRSDGSITKRRLDVYAGLCALVVCDDDFRTLLSDQPLDGTISSSADRDHYVLAGVAGDQVTIVLTRTSGTLDPFLELSDPSGVNVVVNDNGAPDNNALINGYTLLQTGRYLIVARGVGGTGAYRIHLAVQPVVLNPIPRISGLSPDSATGRLLGSDLTVRIFGNNFMPASRAFYDGSARTVRFVSPTELVMTLPRSDLHLPWPDTDPIVVSNPAPGGGTSAPATFSILRPLLGESRLLQPEAGGIVETGVKTTMSISWTAPITVTSWRTMQNMDLRLRDQHGNTAAWVRIVERAGENSVFRLLNAAELSLSQATTETFPLPEEGLPGINKDIVLSDTVTLHLADSAFSASGRTAIMTPTLTFGPNAVGTYNIEFRVDNENGDVQKNDILGKITIVPTSCPYAVVGGEIGGADSGSVGTDYLYTATVVPAQASQPISFTWSPEPKRGQGTATATYNWSSAGERILAVSAQNCGGFGDAIKTVQIRTSEAPDLAIRKVAPSVVKAGERITYTLTVSNSGALPAHNLQITDVVPANATYVSGGALQNGIVNWGVSQLDGYGAAIQVEYVVTAAQTITNSVISVSADGNHSASSNQPVVTIVANDTARVDGVTAGNLVGNRINIQVDAGSFANAAQLALTELAGPTYPLSGTLKSFRLSSFGSPRGGQFYSVTANMSISYVLSPLTAAEGSAREIGLRYWSGSTWSNEGITCVTEATMLNCVVQAPFDTEFVVLETTAASKSFLPFVNR